MPGPFHLIQGEMPTPGCMPCLVAYPGCEGSCRFGTVSLMDGGVAMAMATSTKPPHAPLALLLSQYHTLDRSDTLWRSEAMLLHTN